MGNLVVSTELQRSIVLPWICLLYISNLFQRRLYLFLFHNNPSLTTMDGSVKEDDEDDKDIEMFMSFENRISDLPEYEISLVLHGPEVDEGNLEDSDEDVVLRGSEVDEVNLEDSEDDVVLHGFDTVAFVRRTLSTERSLGSSTVGMNFISIALSNGSCRRMLVHYVKGPQWLFER